MGVRKFRCEDAYWFPAMVKAKGEGTSISAKIRGWVIAYVDGNDEAPPPPG